MIISENTIFYFSGTGNSLQVAKDMALQLEDIQLLSIPNIINNNEIKIQAEYIGIVFPVYVCGLPLIVEKFVKKMNISKSTYIFAVANYGGMPGNALKQVNYLIEGRGAKLNAGFIINMPGNYIVMYGAASNENQIKVFEKEKVKVHQMVEVIKGKENHGQEKSKMVIDRIFGALAYKRINKIHTKDKLFFTKDNCNGCGVCQKVCSVENIELKNGRPIWKNNCEQCMACIQYCPQEAIEYAKKTIGRKRYRNPNVTLQEMISGGRNE